VSYCEYYLDYYIGIISKKDHLFEFLSINYNVQLLEMFIYFHYKVNGVRKGNDNLSDHTYRGDDLLGYSSEGMGGPSLPRLGS